MIARLIAWSAHHRMVVFAAAFLLAVGGAVAARNARLDAIPDLSDTQVIVATEWMGRSPDLVEDQVTWPLSTALLGAPGATTVRGQSMFGMSFVYVIFADGTDPERARVAVAEVMARVGQALPDGVQPRLGPDASGAGWVYQYAVVDDRDAHGPASLRALQETVIAPALQSVEGVAEVATVGGYVEQIEISVDPARMLAHGVGLAQVGDAVARANVLAGGGALEVSGHELMIRTRSEARSLDDLRDAPISGATGAPGQAQSTGAAPPSAPPAGDGMDAMASASSGGGGSARPAESSSTHVVRVRDVADVQRAPAPRRGVTDLDGRGETPSGIVVARQGRNALSVIRAVKLRIAEIERSLPEGVHLVPVYDRSELIEASVVTLGETLAEELLVVSLVIAVFLRHLRTAMVPLITLPVATLAAFLPMYGLGVTINIMSLAGIAVAVGAMVDASILCVENVHVHLTRWEQAGRPGDRREVMIAAMQEVGPSAFHSLLVIGVSFLPVFALEAQEGRLFSPLAWTKTWSMLFASVLAVTLAPALAVTFVRGSAAAVAEEDAVSRALTRVYTPVVRRIVRWRIPVVGAAAAFVAVSIPVALSLPWEFMPPLNEGTLLYMPSAPPGISEAEAGRVLRVLDREVMKTPEVARVFGKMGRANTATDPAPLSMAETVIQLRPRSEWRDGLDWDGLVRELDARVRAPGMPNAWWFPVQTRTEMLSTGIRSPLGIKVFGPTASAVEETAVRLETLLSAVPGTRSLYADRATGGFYLDVDLRRAEAAALGVSAADVAATLEGALAGRRVGEWIDGRRRIPIVVRYARDFRSDPTAVGDALVEGASGTLPLRAVADVGGSSGPDMIRSEGGQLVGYLFVDPGNRPVSEWVEDAEEVLDRAGVTTSGLGRGTRWEWAGTWQALDRALGRLAWMIPLVLLAIAGLMRTNTGSWVATAIIVFSLPFSIAGGAWLLWALDYHLSVAVLVGMIALAGLDAETGVVMLLYLGLAWEKHGGATGVRDAAQLEEVIVDGAARRMRPKLMTVATDVIGFLPVFLIDGTGADLMRRIAAPMLGGLFTSFLVELFVYPAIYAIWRGYDMRKAATAFPP